MKNLLLLIALISSLSLFTYQANAQNQKPSLAVLDIDNQNTDMTPSQLASLARVEITKTNMFEIVDPYDIEYLFTSNEFDAKGCYGKICLIEAGKILGVDKVLSGSVEAFEKHYVITLRQVDVKSGKIEKAHAVEFLKIQNQMDNMIDIAVGQMYGLEVDENTVTKLTKKDDFESTINVTGADALNLSGPRMGLTFFTGDLAKIYQAPEIEGGFNSLPVMTQFGYQFEVKYLNEGNIQALFEFIPVITGLDQGRFIPSITVLSGIRSNKNGFEFGFGPNVFVTKMSEGFVNNNGDFIIDLEGYNPDKHTLTKRLDSRGNATLGSGFVLAVGKTFRSGKLNIPINAFFIPGKKSNQRFGLSFGFNLNGTRM